MNILLETIILNDMLGKLEVYSDGQSFYLLRKNARNNIINKITHIQYITDKNICELKIIDDYFLQKIKEKNMNGANYSSLFVFSEEKNIKDHTYTHIERSNEEHLFTSTGIKFWKHVQHMTEYKTGGHNTVISTHISPEGRCNLKCPYCSVTYRKNVNSIKLDVIKDYVLKLKSRGLKAVILTGGGEPSLYKDFNTLVRWLKDQNLLIGLITNGTNSKKVESDVWKLFSWIRVSVNLFKGWEEKINIPIDQISDDCVVGMSHVFTVEHENITSSSSIEYFQNISRLADKLDVKYIRVLPNCLLDQDTLIRVHKGLDVIFSEINDSRFFHQYKFHEAPRTTICHQSYFRPYLSEEPYYKTGEPGTVYPCDSVVLNESNTHFSQKYQLCSSEDVLEYIDKKIQHKFTPCTDCKGCVFTDNVNMLDDYVIGKIERFDDVNNKILHEEFV